MSLTSKQKKWVSKFRQLLGEKPASVEVVVFPDRIELQVASEVVDTLRLKNHAQHVLCKGDSPQG